ncbi:MAG: putative GTP-binding protein Der [Promethearchaeota archaeon]|nr:MAG: putative GTP-binding protein Der [Candidatus Lokiarchaeota archaeon]
MYDPYIKKNVIKLVIGGPGAVGKTVIAKKLAGDLKKIDNIAMTKGLDVHTIHINQNGKRTNSLPLKIQVWDCAGQEQFYFFQNIFFAKAKIVMLVFSVDNYSTFFELVHWTNLVKDASIIKMYLVGNKIDIENRAVPKEISLEMAKAYEMAYFEISALTNKGFEALRDDLLDRINQSYQKEKEISGDK